VCARGEEQTRRDYDAMQERREREDDALLETGVRRERRRCAKSKRKKNTEMRNEEGISPTKKAHRTRAYKSSRTPG
jgi:hypothetical protein